MEGWLGQHFLSLLKDNSRVLEHWSQQRESIAQRVKNFENWLLVQLVDRLWEARVCSDVQTNGYLRTPSFLDAKCRAPEDLRRCLSGDKGKSGSIVADLSFCLRQEPHSYYVNVELKTQTAAQPILDDLRIVAYHNRHDKNRENISCFAWVVLMPSDRDLRKRVEADIARIEEKAHRDPLIARPLGVRTVPGHPRIRYCIAAPGFPGLSPA